MADSSSSNANDNTPATANGASTAVPLSMPAKFLTKRVYSNPYPFISPRRPELSAAGRNVVVTGGGTGIGEAIAIAFAEAGAASVTVMGRRPEKLEAAVMRIKAAAAEPDTTRVLAVPTDLTKAQQVTDSLRDIVDRVGSVDVLVSNAAGKPPVGCLTDTPPKVLAENFEQNVISTLNVLTAFSKLHRPARARRPVVIHVSTGMVHLPPLMIGGAAYAITKTSALKLVHYFAAENPDFHVVSVHPGIVQTAMSSIPAMDQVELPGHFTVWLASKEAEFLRDKFVWVNWDAEELVARKHEIMNTELLNWTLQIRTPKQKL